MKDDEEKSPKASPLTLTRVFKTPAEGEEVERIKKRTYQLREIVLIVEAKGEYGNDERGIFEDYTKQPVLFPTTSKKTAALPIRTENRGK